MTIVQQFVKQVVVYKDKITIEYNIFETYTILESIQRKTSIKLDVRQVLC